MNDPVDVRYVDDAKAREWGYENWHEMMADFVAIHDRMAAQRYIMEISSTHGLAEMSWYRTVLMDIVKKRPDEKYFVKVLKAGESVKFVRSKSK